MKFTEYIITGTVRDQKTALDLKGALTPLHAEVAVEEDGAFQITTILDRVRVWWVLKRLLASGMFTSALKERSREVSRTPAVIMRENRKRDSFGNLQGYTMVVRAGKKGTGRRLWECKVAEDGRSAAAADQMLVRWLDSAEGVDVLIMPRDDDSTTEQVITIKVWP